VSPNLHALRRAEASQPGVRRMLGCFRDNALTRQEFLGMAT
jgi:hypothetical protein